MSIIAQVMLLSQGAATVPPSVLVRPPVLPIIEDERLTVIIEDPRKLTIIRDRRETVIIDDGRSVPIPGENRSVTPNELE